MICPPIGVKAENAFPMLNEILLSQIATPARGELERWLAPAAAVLTLVALGRKVLGRKIPLESEFVNRKEFERLQQTVERASAEMRDRLDARFDQLTARLEALKTELAAEGNQRHLEGQGRLAALEAGLARLDERTHGSRS